MNATEPPILTTLDDGVLAITLNRPHRLNAFTAEMHQQMLTALREAQRDPGVRVIVIAGAGGRHRGRMGGPSEMDVG